MLARRIVVGFGIAVILPWLIYCGLSAVYPAPKGQDYYGDVPGYLLPTMATPDQLQA
jgi:hypothetical protein